MARGMVEKWEGNVETSIVPPVPEKGKHKWEWEVENKRVRGCRYGPSCLLLCAQCSFIPDLLPPITEQHSCMEGPPSSMGPPHDHVKCQAHLHESTKLAIKLTWESHEIQIRILFIQAAAQWMYRNLCLWRQVRMAYWPCDGSQCCGLVVMQWNKVESAQTQK